MTNGLAAFIEFLRENEAPREELDRLTEEKKGKALDEAIVALAASLGFTFTRDDLDKAVEDTLARLLLDDRLEEHELEEVGGEKRGCFLGWIGKLLLGPQSGPQPEV